MAIAGYTVGFIFLLILFVDIYVIFKHGVKASISSFCVRHSKKYPIFPFILGLLMGHITWSLSDFDWMTKEQIQLKCKEYLEGNNE